MSVTSAEPTSRRAYLSRAELQEFANITITDSTEADDRISQAEEIIDSYVGPQIKHLDYEVTGRAASGTTTTLTLQSKHQNIYEKDFFKLCEIEIIGGTNVGERRKVTGSTKAGVLTVDTAFSNANDTTSMYRIYQLGKFPRHCDVVYFSDAEPYQYYKTIPEAVKRAVAAQIEYLVEMGDSFFASEKSELKSESIGNYSYELSGNPTALRRLIAPKAKVLLRGYINRTGTIIA